MSAYLDRDDRGTGFRGGPHGSKKRYGTALAFWGGIDTQYILPRGTLEEVRDEVKRRIDDLARGGGYLVAPVHNIQPDVRRRIS